MCAIYDVSSVLKEHQAAFLQLQRDVSRIASDSRLFAGVFVAFVFYISSESIEDRICLCMQSGEYEQSSFKDGGWRSFCNSQQLGLSITLRARTGIYTNPSCKSKGAVERCAAEQTAILLKKIEVFVELLTEYWDTVTCDVYLAALCKKKPKKNSQGDCLPFVEVILRGPGRTEEDETSAKAHFAPFGAHPSNHVAADYHQLSRMDMSLGLAVGAHPIYWQVVLRDGVSFHLAGKMLDSLPRDTPFALARTGRHATTDFRAAATLVARQKERWSRGEGGRK